MIWFFSPSKLFGELLVDSQQLLLVTISSALMEIGYMIQVFHLHFFSIFILEDNLNVGFIQKHMCNDLLIQLGPMLTYQLFHSCMGCGISSQRIIVIYICACICKLSGKHTSPYWNIVHDLLQAYHSQWLLEVENGGSMWCSKEMGGFDDHKLLNL